MNWWTPVLHHRRCALAGRLGLWAEIEPGPGLVEFIELHARKQKQGRAVLPPPGAPNSAALLHRAQSRIRKPAFTRREELSTAGEAGASGVFSKLDSFDQLIARIASELPSADQLAAKAA